MSGTLEKRVELCFTEGVWVDVLKDEGAESHITDVQP